MNRILTRNDRSSRESLPAGKPMHIGVVCSTNGGAFRAIHRVVSSIPSMDCRWHVVTDRKCGVEDFCSQHQIPWKRFENRTNEEFSRDAANWFSEAGSLACVQLFYSRLITESLYAAFPTVNFHPSLLPAFPGMNSVRKAIQHGARFLGATAHLVDAGVDTGPIIAQACDPLDATSTDAELDRISYLQKVQLGLVVIHLINNRQLLFSQDNQRFKLSGALRSSPSCNPALACDDLYSAYRNLIAGDQIEVPV